MEINGLPLHPLIVHATVVLVPIAALVALLYVAVPKWRDRLRWPMSVGGVLGGILIYATYLTGNSFRDANPTMFDNQDLTEVYKRIQAHQELANTLVWVTIAFGVIALMNGWLHKQSGGTRIALNALLVAGAVATLVFVFLTGEAGARALWDGTRG